jgi:hypothetical protein
VRRDRDSKGGGILAYINTDFPVSRKTNLESETLENISVEVHINKNKWLVIGIYKPPSMSDAMNRMSLKVASSFDSATKNMSTILSDRSSLISSNL